MQSIGDIIQAIARQRGRGDTQPLILLRQTDSSPGERISHLPIDTDLAQAWVALTGEPFRPHQAHALMALRRGELVALHAASADVVMSAYLLLYATLRSDPGTTALLLVPDNSAAQHARARINQLNDQLPRSLHLNTIVIEPQIRPDPYARLVIATPDTLHARLLRHHDRAWRLFWPRLRLVVLPDIQRYAGVAGAHLADLLLRVQRTTANHSDGQIPNLLATLFEVADPEPALAGLIGQAWRIVSGDDGPRTATTLAVWRNPDTGKGSRMREVVELAAAVQRQGYNIHIVCKPLERALIAPIAGDIPGITFGPDLPPVQVLIVAGYPATHSALRRMLHAGYQAVIVVLGELPHEQMLARHAEMLLSDPPTSWPAPAANAYVTAQHILCAATEQPLTAEEVEAWGAQDIVARLVAHGQLVDLPDPEVAWKPTDAAGDPYAEFSLLSSSGGPIIARAEQGQAMGLLDPTGFERWTYPNATLPPGAGGLRVLARDEEAGSVTLRPENNSRRTYPLRRCEVQIREMVETRTLRGGSPIGWGRVVTSEEIYGYREATPASAPADVALRPPLTTRWTAPACWFDRPAGLAPKSGPDMQVAGQFIGWSLAAALAVRALAAFTDVVPCYDPESRRLYLVDAQPGGSGLAAWVYAHAEALLPLAYDVALACRNDPLLEPLSRSDMDWLLPLLGRPAEEAIPLGPTRQAERVRTGERTRAPERPARSEGPPRIILTPAPPESAPARLPREEPPAPARSQPPATERPVEPPAPRVQPPVEPPAAPASGSGPRSGSPPPPDDYIPHHPPRDRRPPRREPARPPESRPTQQDFSDIEPRNQNREPRTENRQPIPPSGNRSFDQNREPTRGYPTENRQPAPASPNRSSDQNREPGTENHPEGTRPRAENRQPAPTNANRSFDPPARPGRGTPPAPPQEADDDGPPDPAALIARLRRQRQQREAAQGRAAPPSDRRASSSPELVEQRFTAGEQVFCLPYGNGTIQSSSIEDGRELLVVAFPDHGELTIDPAVSLVRKLADAPADDDDLL